MINIAKNFSKKDSRKFLSSGTSGLLPTPQASDGTTGQIIGKKDKFYITKTGVPRKINKNGVDGSIGLARRILLTSSQEVSRVSLFPKPDEEKERMITVISGRKCLESYGNSNRHGLLLKMFVACLLSNKAWYSNKSALTWKPVVTKSSRLLFQLYPLTRRIDGTGSGLLPTATSSDHKSRGAGSKQIGLDNLMKLLPTPTCSGLDDFSDKGLAKGHLHAVVIRALLPTPRVSDVEGSPVKNVELKNGRFSRINKKGIRFGVKVKDVVAMLPTPRAGNPGSRPNGKGGKILNEEIGKTTGLKLQPNFVEWMMGYPQNWTDLNCPNQGIG